jgi:hypothetical protein
LDQERGMVGQVDYEARPVRPPPHLGADPVETEYRVARLRRISWGAIFAGIAVSLMVHLLLSLLGLGIGLSTIDSASQRIPDIGALGTTGGIWWAVSGIIAALIGGWVAARASGVPSGGSGAIHGLVTWAATALLVLFILGSVVGGAMSGLFATASRVLPGAATELSDIAPAAGEPGTSGARQQEIIEEARNLIGAAAANPDEIADVIGGALPPEATPQERAAAVTLLVQQAGLTQAQAEARLEDWRQAYREAAGGARATAQTAAEVSSAGALAGFVALLLGALAGALGGVWGAPRDVLIEDAG